MMRCAAVVVGWATFGLMKEHKFVPPGKRRVFVPGKNLPLLFCNFDTILVK